jgi:hypothetical protein
MFWNLNNSRDFYWSFWLERSDWLNRNLNFFLVLDFLRSLTIQFFLQYFIIVIFVNPILCIAFSIFAKKYLKLFLIIHIIFT